MDKIEDMRADDVREIVIVRNVPQQLKCKTKKQVVSYVSPFIHIVQSTKGSSNTRLRTKLATTNCVCPQYNHIIILHYAGSFVCRCYGEYEPASMSVLRETSFTVGYTSWRTFLVPFNLVPVFSSLVPGQSCSFAKQNGFC